MVVGILAALALPAYRHHMLRVNRAEAMTALLQLQSAEEAYYLRHGTYTASVEAAPPAGLGLSATSTSNKYALSVALAADGQSYIATATPTHGGGQERGSANASPSPSMRAGGARSADAARHLLA